MVPNSGLRVSGAQDAEQQASTPQIFTTNPLKKIINKLARLFGKNNRSVPAANAPLSEAQARARFGTVISDGNSNGSSASSSNDETDGMPDSQQPLDNLYQNQEGEWVLIQQTAPEGSVGGMHEINANENAYERYVKYERAARFTPTPAEEREDEVPDSKLARLFKPIKRFLGFEDTPSTNNLDGAIASAGRAAQTGETEMLGQNPFESELRKPRTPSMNMGSIAVDVSNGVGGNSSSRNPTADLLNILNPYRAVDRAAEMLADAKYPNPANAAEEQKKKEFTEENKQRFAKQVDTWLKTRMEQAAAKETAGSGDVLTQILSSCSGDPRSAFVSSSECDGSDQPQGSVAEDRGTIEQIRQENERYFLESLAKRAHLKDLKKMPEASITLILGKVDSQTTADALDKLLEDAQDEVATAKEDTAAGEEEHKKKVDEAERKAMLVEKYAFQVKAANCSAEDPCFWVGNANSSQHEPGKPNTQGAQDSEIPLLQNTIYATGLKLSAYENVTQKLDADFAAYKSQNASTDQEKESIAEKAKAAQTPYIVVKGSQLKEKQEQNKVLAQQGNFGQILNEGSIIMTGSAKAGLEASQAVGPFLVFAEDNKPVSARTSDETAATRSRAAEEGVLDFAADVAETVENMTNEAAKQAIVSSTNKLVQGLNKSNKPNNNKTAGPTPQAGSMNEIQAILDR